MSRRTYCVKLSIPDRPSGPDAFESKLAHLSAQRGTGDAEDLARLAPVPPRRFESTGDSFFFDIHQSVTPRTLRTVDADQRPLADGRPLCHDQRTGQHALQFSHVPRPVVPRQLIEGSAAEPGQLVAEPLCDPLNKTA